jgi:hypothetical protein
MLDFNVDAERSIVHLRPKTALTKEDFDVLGAVVTDAKLGEVAEKLASHFVSAEIRHFPAGQAKAAAQWIAG